MNARHCEIALYRVIYRLVKAWMRWGVPMAQVRLRTLLEDSGPGQLWRRWQRSRRHRRSSKGWRDATTRHY